MKLSEKGCEQCFERESWPVYKAQNGLKWPFSAPVGLRGEHLRTFSDSFVGVFSELRL